MPHGVLMPVILIFCIVGAFAINNTVFGVGIILVADTLEEAIGLSHTIAVIRDGEIRKWYDCPPGGKPSLYDLIHYMT